jgi:hypothetical protein
MSHRPAVRCSSPNRSIHEHLRGHVAVLIVLTAAMDGEPPRRRAPRGLHAARDWSAWPEQDRGRLRHAGVRRNGRPHSPTVVQLTQASESPV